MTDYFQQRRIIQDLSTPKLAWRLALKTWRELLSNQPIRQLNIRGNKQFLANLELEFPIVKAVGLSGVFFWDFGNVYAPTENLFYLGDKDLKNKYKDIKDPLGLFYGLGLYSAAGFEVRWLGPFGALRF